MSPRDCPPVRRTHAPDPAAAEAAIRAFLDALGFDPAQPGLAGTPRRVAAAYLGPITQGYEADPVATLGDGFPAPGEGALFARELPLMFTCPHHLTLAFGVAHVGIIPGAVIPGLGRIAKLVDALSRRLILQEELTHAIAQALYEGLGASATAVRIEARHGCVALEDFARASTSIVTEATRGATEAERRELSAALRGTAR